MINPGYPLPITRQAKALGIAPSTVYARVRADSDRDLDLMDRIEKACEKAWTLMSLGRLVS